MFTFLQHNHVFPKADIKDVMCGLQTLKNAGRPAVFNKTHRVLNNNWWGIQGGYDVEVVYVYNDHCTDFEHSLPEDTQQHINAGLGHGFHNYPFMSGVLQNLM